MRKAKRVILSPENIQLLKKLCREVGSADEAEKDPNFVLERFLKTIDEMGSEKGVSHIMQFSITRSMLEGARQRMKEGEAA